MPRKKGPPIEAVTLFKGADGQMYEKKEAALLSFFKDRVVDILYDALNQVSKAKLEGALDLPVLQDIHGVLDEAAKAGSFPTRRRRRSAKKKTASSDAPEKTPAKKTPAKKTPAKKTGKKNTGGRPTNAERAEKIAGEMLQMPTSEAHALLVEWKDKNQRIHRLLLKELEKAGSPLVATPASSAKPAAPTPPTGVTTGTKEEAPPPPPPAAPPPMIPDGNDDGFGDGW